MQEEGEEDHSDVKKKESTVHEVHVPSSDFT